MNLLQKRISSIGDGSTLTLGNFRQHQYNMMPYFCDVIIDYLSRLNNNYMTLSNKKIENQINYFGIYNSQMTEMSINIDTSDGSINKQFMKILLPTLIDGNFFFLNGNYYVPTLYVMDLPITVKKESMKLFSLFNSITLYMKDDISIFTGVNIPLSYFLQLFLNDDEDGMELYNELDAKYGLKHKQHTEENILNYFATSKFQFNGTKEGLITFLENIFFDDYTRRLYEQCYDFQNVSLATIIKEAIRYDIEDARPSFIDLTKKRVVFNEVLLRPVFDKVAALAKSAWTGYKPDEMRIDQLAILKYFLTSADKKQGQKGLSGNYLYNTNNLYSAILQHKVSMVPPGVENTPREVQSIHPSHFGKICPITISSQKPGHVVSIIPETKLSASGRFL